MRWISTPESVENGEPTVLAIIETVLAVTLYWWLAWAFDTHIHLLASIIVAPFLLLRSPESIKRGLEWFVGYMYDEKEISPLRTPITFFGVVLFAFSIAYLCTEMVSNNFLSTWSSWSSFGHDILIGFFALMVEFMVAFAILGERAKKMPFVVALLIVGIFGIGIEVVGALGILVAILIIGGALNSMAAGAIFLLPIFSIPVGVGIWFRSIFVRFFATARHPIAGIISFGNNWRQIVWAVDSKHFPEIVPELGSQTENLSLKKFLQYVQSEDWNKRYISLVSYPIIFIPTMFYRWSLKSTCWLYLPLVYLISKTNGQSEFLVSTLHRSRGESARIWLALAVILSTVVTTFSYSQFATLKEAYANIPVPVYLWAFNLGDLAPWQWFSLVGAFMTGIIYFYVDRVVISWNLLKEREEKARPNPVQANRLLWFARLRSISSVLAIFMALGYAGLVFLEIHTQQLPGWLSFLDLIYGPYLP
ncbi:MAG: hypothetical protein HQL72_12150 [Magnetococcales bacterium]|nr:hypothetical protein [Magnetococcales bacterium]